jgi:response regulator of citrate/malate metabolism
MADLIMEIKEFLIKEKEKWFSVREIAERLGITYNSARKRVFSLVKWNFVHYKFNYVNMGKYNVNKKVLVIRYKRQYKKRKINK